MDNRSNLITCALTLFASRGYDAIGVQEIVNCAGVTKPSLYHYFGSKRGLLDVLLEENYHSLFSVLLPVLDYQHDLPFTLEKITRTYFNYAVFNPLFYRFLLSLYVAPVENEAKEAVFPYLQKQTQLLEDLFLQAAVDHGNMKGRHKPYAATFIGMINTYITLFLDGGESLDDHLAYLAVHQYMHGIFS